MRARRRSTGSDLPHAPLLMLHPLAVPGAQVPGREIVREIRTPVGALLYALHWAALSWSYSGTPAPQLAQVERDALARMGEGEPWAAIAILAGQLTGSEPPNPSEMAQACHCIADWALAQEARETAIAFMVLGALVFPRHPRYAWAAGRMLREYGKMREAEAWFRRAHRVAVWSRDWEARVRTVASLGNLSYAAGNWPRANARLLRALGLARRHGLTELAAETLHDLFGLAIARGEFMQAEDYGIGAAELYGADHKRLPALAFDFAALWIHQGYFARALPVLTQIYPHFSDTVTRARVLSAMARAAGACGDLQHFESAWNTTWALAPALAGRSAHASCMLDLGLGASSLGRWEDARTAFEAVLAEPHSRGNSDAKIFAEAALKRVARGQRAEAAHAALERVIPAAVTRIVQTVALRQG